jgi:glycosyltransferase involved in cell wall biosynthesis
VKGRIQLLGGISREQVERELAEAEVFSLVSLEENAPLVIEEAMAAGVPVVASNRCGMPYLVRHGETGFLVDPHRAENIAYRLALLVRDAGLRKKMGERSRAVALERFHPERVAARTREVYREAEKNRHCLK